MPVCSVSACNKRQSNSVPDGDCARCETDEDEFVAYNSSKSIKSIMLDYKGSDFTSELFRMLLIRREISHLFLSDIEALES